jgi:molecular chaperone DnaK
MEDAVAKLEEVHKAENLDELDAAMEAVNTAWAGASQEIYAASQAEAEAAATAAGAEGDAAGGGESSAADDNDAVDADFEVVDEEDKDK